MDDEKKYEESENIPVKDATDEAETKEDETDETSTDESDEPGNPPDEPSSSDENESQAEGVSDSKKSASNLPKRGPRFRKQLLKRIPVITYPDRFESKELSMESWIGKIMNLKESDYLDPLQRLVSKSKGGMP
jgi:hypothetical protein